MHLLSFTFQTACLCFICLQTYVSNTTSGCFKSRSGVLLVCNGTHLPQRPAAAARAPPSRRRRWRGRGGLSARATSGRHGPHVGAQNIGAAGVCGHGGGVLARGKQSAATGVHTRTGPDVRMLALSFLILMTINFKKRVHINKIRYKFLDSLWHAYFHNIQYTCCEII